jgi:flagellar hook capping protein FlgD
MAFDRNPAKLSLFRSSFLIAVMAISLLPCAAHAQWPANGRTYTGNDAVSDGAGNFISRGVAKFDTTGAILWSVNPGLNLLRGAPDGAGGVMVIKTNPLSGGTGVYADRVSTTGTVLWSGAVLTTASISTAFPIRLLATDAAGNGFAAWKASDQRLFVGKVSPSGVPQWGATGVLVSNAANNFAVPRAALVPDELGGCYFVWEDYRAGTTAGPSDIYAQRVTSAGTVAWTTNGIAVASGPANEFQPAACSDGAGGVMVVWADNRDGPNYYDVFAQRLDGSGASLWTAGGARIYTDAAGNLQDQVTPFIVADGSGGAFLAWSDYRNAGLNHGSDVFAQKINSSGAAQWGADGVAVAATTNSEAGPRVVLDGAGGVFVGWTSPGGVLQHLTGAGAALWLANGVRPASAVGNADDIIADAIGGCYFGTASRLGRFLPNGNPVWPRYYQVAASIHDVLGDEGGWADLTFDRLPPDIGVAAGTIWSDVTITSYSIWRKRPGSSASIAPARLEDPMGILAGLASVPSVGGYLTGYTDFPPGTWDVVLHTPALPVPAYSILVPTHADSTSAGFGNDEFVVLSHNGIAGTGSGLFVVSPPATGHSVDNLAPGVPQNVTGGKTGPNSVMLAWSQGIESDLWHYSVYRGDAPSFTPSAANRIGQPTSTSFEDTGFDPANSYYKISTVDRHENESGFALLAPNQIISVPPGTAPAHTYLSPALPNPSRGETSIEFGVAHRSEVSIDIYDSNGRRVRQLVHEFRDPGVYRAVWDGGDDARHAAAAGIYFARFAADGLRQNVKFVRM